MSPIAGLDLGPNELILAAGIAAAGGFLRGFTGFGANLMMAPLFALLFGPVVAVTLSLTLDLTAALTMVPRAVRHVRWSFVARVTVAGLFGLPVGASLLTLIEPEILRRIIAVVLLLSCGGLLFGWRYSGPRAGWVEGAVGFVAGVLGGVTSMGGPPVVLYMMSCDERAVVIRATIHVVSVFLFGAALLWFYLRGVLVEDTLVLAVGVMPFLLVMAWLGAAAFGRLGDHGYRRAALWLLAGIGIVTLLI